MSGIRDYIDEHRDSIKKGLEPTKCGLCGGSHATTSLFMCGTCMDGFTNYMGGDAVASRVRGGPSNAVKEERAKTSPVTSHSSTNAARGAVSRSSVANEAATLNEPEAVGSKSGPRSEKDGAYVRPEEPSTHTSTNATRAHSSKMPR
jgi:hypothetical protein